MIANTRDCTPVQAHLNWHLIIISSVYYTGAHAHAWGCGNWLNSKYIRTMPGATCQYAENIAVILNEGIAKGTHDSFRQRHKLEMKINKRTLVQCVLSCLADHDVKHNRHRTQLSSPAPPQQTKSPGWLPPVAQNGLQLTASAVSSGIPAGIVLHNGSNPSCTSW